ncbi:MAG: tRNA (adenosine(37)-N6)-threonylcarbamoyltransferase complex ATPase subunit type 1 TsaE [Candidatus Pacebacteria bacterium]|nr:tRNA (adenosine(37)-N6)-threonylcarbamoyltransferase complex ATPase subunit type 1 TsaE [Candidatus Paceibacterota bacterium]MDD4074322.1 tRNA (adenosine(37)-N6)-threonylcarbamoyltransferase complex ATPase subunit type 1 TsaE [Candidatus Paceibacterota bacterium]
MKIEYFSENLKETKEIGKSLAKDRKRFIVFEGDLGAGKTSFIQGFAKGLGLNRKITSPTFIIMNKYPLKNKKFFCHFDFYRIKNKKELNTIPLKDIFTDKNNIICIEWPKIVKSFLPKDIIKIQIVPTDENKRKIIIDYGK